MNRRVKAMLIWAMRLLAAAVVLFPIWRGLMLSLMPRADMYVSPPLLLPSVWTVRSYVAMLGKDIPFLTFFVNSVGVAVLVTLTQVVTCSLAAYAFSYLDFPGRKALFIASLATMMIPFECTYVSNYIFVARMGWLNRWAAMVLPYAASAMGIFLMRQYFLSLPMALNDAARVDGCGRARFLFQILMPLSRPGMVSLGVYIFLNTWNQYLWPLLVTNTSSARTIQIGIAMLRASGEYGEQGPLMAATILAIAPSILLFALGQRQLVRGMTQGAVKG